VGFIKDFLLTELLELLAGGEGSLSSSKEGVKFRRYLEILPS